MMQSFITRRLSTATSFVLVVCGVAVLDAGPVSSRAAASITFGTLLEEMLDRDLLAVYPVAEGGYKMWQASSRNPMETTLGRPANFANPDCTFFQGSEFVDGQWEQIMLYDTGPGAITRWWMTGTSTTTGEVRVYVDGRTTPVLSGQFRPLLGANANFGPELSFTSRTYAPDPNKTGANLYAPIPYSKSIKVTYRGSLSPDPTVWYNINYRKFNAARTVQTYSAGDTTTYAGQLSAATAALAAPSVTGNVNKQHTQNVTLATGQDVVYTLRGGGAIRQLQISVTGADKVAALRNTYLELIFDGRRTARVPVGHFFGNGDGSPTKPYNNYEDFSRTVAADGTMTARWVMPFRDAAQVRLVNEGSQTVNVALRVDSGDWTWDTNSLHFHANFREEQGIPTRPGKDSDADINGTADWRALTIRGKGVYVGDTLSLLNRSSIWWGEGDEKIYVDYIDANGKGHAAKPDHFGTGTEDYYGYAHCHTATFIDKAFIAQPIGSGNLAPGRTVNSRVRVLDAIPFTGSFKFDMEIWTRAGTQLDYGITTYWYGAPGLASAMRVAADLAADYKTNVAFTVGGIPDTAGDGHWLYLSSSKANPADPDAQTAPLVFGAVGNAGNPGYGGGQNSCNLAAVSAKFITTSGGDNIGTQGVPGYHELALHPAGTTTQSGWVGDAAMPFVVARWIAGASSIGLANIYGSVRNLVNNNDGVDFYIYVDNRLKFSAAAAGATLPETYFDFDVTLSQGSVVDFVVGNNGAGNLIGDETWLRATILVLETQPIPEHSTSTISAAAFAALVLWNVKQRKKRRRRN